MKNTTTITLDDRKMNILLSWIYSDCKPTDWHEVDKVLVRQLKKACDRLDCCDLIEEFIVESEKKCDEFGNKIDEDEIKKRKKAITNMDGIFYCPKCNLRTNEKTFETKCVICNSALNRG